MISFEIEMDKLLNTVNFVAKNLHKQIAEVIKKQCENIQETAVYFAPTNMGTLKNNIKVEVKEGDNIVGKIYVDEKIAYQFFVEYGTGIYASPKGTGSKAKKIPWYVHEDMANLEKYNFNVVYGKNGDKYYQIYGTKPHPFMEPASKSELPKTVPMLKKEIGRLFK